MTEHRDDIERFVTLAEAILEHFKHITTLLKDLPLPIKVVAFDFESETPEKPLLSLDYARRLVKDEPISQSRKTAFGQMIVEWFTAYEMLAFIQVAGPAPWRLVAVEFALQRLEALERTITTREVDEDKS